ncbi:BON domain-containing protein [Chitinispirillales bacterium ANBcel5]|uniref:BON domain-containing protein n=1 Tax=Cellulosispirillum alkaliphilum TaxID=3039283 RepID=UPI002A539BB9|nr:BON domain-containing protein [Chitinispirillales bacterium ANBcel5]
MLYSNEETKKRIVDQLFWDSRVDASEVLVEVSNGAVHLYGTVPTAYARESAESDVWAVPGVKVVENRIAVRLDQPAAPPRAELRDNIRNIFDWDTALSGEDIVISVDNGVVTLEGAVGSYWQKKRAEELAKHVAGVILVDDRLGVTPKHDLNDEIIAEDIIDALDRNIDIDIDMIDVMVEEGRVRLSGKVPDWAAYKAANTIVQYTAGVTDLQNDLVIAPDSY